MKNPFSGIDWSKLTVNTLSGFIVSMALLFGVDAFLPGHIAENMLTADTPFGFLFVVGIAIIIGSSILGLMVDSIFQTFGRYFARKFWRPVKYEIRYRGYCMRDVGLVLRDFEWIYASSKEKMSAEVEKDYLRFTEVAGSSAYAMLLLLSPVSYLFLRLEYGNSDLVSFFAAGIIAFAAMVLLVTSAESLSKYENKKTAAVLGDIRKLSSHFLASEQRAEDSRQKPAHWWSRRGPDHWWSPRLLYLLAPVAAVVILLWCSQVAAAYKMLEGKQMTNLVSISKPVNNDIPNVDINVSRNSLVTPGDQAASMVVTLNDWLREPTTMHLKNNNLVESVTLPRRPKWNLYAELDDASAVKSGDRIYINLFLSFDQPSKTNVRVSAGEIVEGNWLFPVIVTDDKKDYLLAQVHVKIAAAPSSAGAANAGGGQAAPAAPAAGGSSPASGANPSGGQPTPTGSSPNSQ